MPAPKGNQNARKETGVQPLYLKITCDQELTQLLRQSFYSSQHPHRWPESNQELAEWVRKYIRHEIEMFARKSTDWELFLFEADEEEK